ncbi:MAG: FprA family A-type flavoprotein [Clostridiales bacterium]|nr:FprA family A-type flavoprotein [Clostridiales bacterium]
MHKTSDIRYIGVNDHEIDLFEGQYAVPNGMAYNSYAIVDGKIAVMDSVDRHFAGEWLEHIAQALGGRTPDYLIVQHMEPDHSGSIEAFMDAYPQATIVSSTKAFSMMQAFFGKDYADRRLAVKEGDTLSLGRHELRFFTAPMVHWPEVFVTYDACEKALFSADAFGKFGALDVQEDWADEARRYYIGIVGKYGAQVQALLKKLAALDVQTICPLHGPVLEDNLASYLALYDCWSSYRPESHGVTIACASIYGGTMKAARLLADQLHAQGETVVLYDLARCDMAQAVSDAFRYDRLVLASSTYNADVFPFMRTFIHHLTERGFRNRTVALMESGAWAPMAAKVMHGMLESSKELTFAETAVKITCAPSDATQAQIDALAAELHGA